MKNSVTNSKNKTVAIHVKASSENQYWKWRPLFSNRNPTTGMINPQPSQPLSRHCENDRLAKRWRYLLQL